MDRMRSKANVLLIAVLMGLLVSSTLACPLWMAFLNEGTCGMPGVPSFTGTSSQQCPMAVCQLSAPYLAADSGAPAPVMTKVVAQSIVSHTIWISFANAESVRQVQQEGNGPPGSSSPLFLSLHSLRI